MCASGGMAGSRDINRIKLHTCNLILQATLALDMRQSFEVLLLRCVAFAQIWGCCSADALHVDFILFHHDDSQTAPCLPSITPSPADCNICV